MNIWTFCYKESTETHSGLKKLCFDLEKFPEFKNKIIYGVIKNFSNLNAWEKKITKTLFQNFKRS